MDFKELGQMLRAERESRGLSISDIHAQLKIGPSSVEAIESGDVQNLPHMVYYRGFVKNYATFLGLDLEHCLKAFEQEHSFDQEGEEPDEELEKIPEELSHVFQGKKWTIASILLGLCLLGVLGWLMTQLFWSTPQDQQSKSVQQPASGQEEGLRPEQEQGESALPAQKGASVQSSEELNPESVQGQATKEPEPGLTETAGPNSQPGARQETGIGEAGPDSNQEEETGTEQPEELGQSATGTTPPPVEAAVDKHTLKISASEACWLSAEMDDRSKDIYLRPGESITLHFVRELSVKLGNAGGVQLIFDDEPYELEADSGEVLTLNFP